MNFSNCVAGTLLPAIFLIGGFGADKPRRSARTQDKMDLVAFLNSLSGEGWQNITPPEKFPQ